MTGRLTIVKIADEHYGWEFTTDKGEVLVNVDGYADVDTLKKDLKRVQKHLPNAEIPELVVPS